MWINGKGDDEYCIEHIFDLEELTKICIEIANTPKDTKKIFISTEELNNPDIVKKKLGGLRSQWADK